MFMFCASDLHRFASSPKAPRASIAMRYLGSEHFMMVASELEGAADAIYELNQYSVGRFTSALGYQLISIASIVSGEFPSPPSPWSFTRP